MQVISMGNGGSPSDNILGISQQIETALAVGREQIRKLRDDVLAMQARHQQISIENERKIQEGQTREQQLGQTLSAHQQAAARRERVLSSDGASQRERADALQRDLDNALRQMDQARTEARSKIEAISQREETLKGETTSLRGMQEALKATVAQLQSRVTQLQESFEKSRAEVELYKTSWAQVLQMERDARAYLQKKEETESKIRALESRNGDLLGEAKSRIRELENSRQNLITQLEQSRKEAAAAIARLETEQRAAAEERANAGCALRAAEEERARSIEAQQAVTQTREQSHIAVTHAREQAQAAERQATELRARLLELERAPGNATQAPAASNGTSSSAVPAATATSSESGSEPQIEIQLSDLSEDFERISSSRTQLETERDTLKKQLAQAMQEMGVIRERSDRMRRNYPLRDLLAHKESELTSAVRELKKIDQGAPARAKAEEIVEMLSEQRDQLRGILRDSEMGRS